MEKLLSLRGAIGQAVEQARQEKLIGNALEGAVTLALADEPLLASLAGTESDLEEFFILSDLTLIAGGGNQSDHRSARPDGNARAAGGTG